MKQTMRYLIMKAIDCNEGQDKIPNPVGVFDLSFKKIETLMQIVRKAMNPAYIRGANFVSSVFMGPELNGLADRHVLQVPAEKEAAFSSQGFIVIQMEDPLHFMYPIDMETIEVRADGHLSWQCNASVNGHPGTYTVCAPPPEKWNTILEQIKQQDIAEASEQPLTWDEARKMVMLCETNAVFDLLWARKGDTAKLAAAIRQAVDDDHARLDHIQRARLKATLERAKP
jgi:hypothetical protein